MLRKVYDKLLKEYGKQGWWPVTPAGKLKPEYSGGPVNQKQQLEVMLGAILTQNTAWKNVEKALINLNRAKLIDADKLGKMPAKRLSELIRPSGYFNQKAKKLKALAAFLKENPLDKLEKMQTAKLRRLLLEVKGIGPETADSMILYAFNKASFVVDAYTKRIFSRLGALDKNAKYGEIQELFHQNLTKRRQLYNEYHALIVEHGKNVCRKKPLCTQCALNGLCKRNI